MLLVIYLLQYRRKGYYLLQVSAATILEWATRLVRVNATCSVLSSTGIILSSREGIINRKFTESVLLLPVCDPDDGNPGRAQILVTVYNLNVCLFRDI